MNTGQGNERIYDLLEKYGFSELNEIDKSFVLSCMDEQYYNSMRAVISETAEYFSKAEQPVLDNTLYKSLTGKAKMKTRIAKILKLPVELYKIAASILLILGIYLFFQQFKPLKQDRLLAANDTIVVYKTDTIFHYIKDTVKVIQEKIVYMPVDKQISLATFKKPLPEIAVNCQRDVCPDDMEKIQSLSKKTNLSSDTAMANFIEALN